MKIICFVDRIRASADAGRSWLIASLFGLVLSAGSSAAGTALSPLRIEWQSALGGTVFESPAVVAGLKSGGCAIVVSSNSDPSGNRTAPRRSLFTQGVDTWVVALDEHGNKVWDVSFGGTTATRPFGLVERPDETLLVASWFFGGLSGNRTAPLSQSRSNLVSTQHDAWVVLLDPHGNTLWERAYGGPGLELGASMIGLPDGGFVLAGAKPPPCTNTFLPYCDPPNGWILRADKDGNVLWEKQLTPAQGERRSWFRSVAQTADGGFLCVGRASFPSVDEPNVPDLDTHAPIVARYRADGSLVGYGARDGAVEYSKVISQGEGGFVIVPTVVPAAFRIVHDGGLGFYAYSCAPKAVSESVDVMAARDGGFLILGRIDELWSTSRCPWRQSGPNYGASDYLLVRTDSQFRQLWELRLGGNLSDDAYSMSQAADGGYFLAGSSSSVPSGTKTAVNAGDKITEGDGRSHYPPDVWVVKVSPDIYPARSDSVELAVAPAFTDPMVIPPPPDNQRIFNGYYYGLRLSLTGISNRLHLVESSTNLVNWVPVSTNWIGSYGTIVVDQAATNQIRRFYRATALDP